MAVGEKVLNKQVMKVRMRVSLAEQERLGVEVMWWRYTAVHHEDGEGSARSDQVGTCMGLNDWGRAPSLEGLRVRWRFSGICQTGRR